MRSISKQGLTLLKQFEGFSATPYFCAAGKFTIGYGHLIRAGEYFPPAGISEGEAEYLLRQDAAIAAQAVQRLVKVPLNQSQFDALACLAYNIGSGAFAHSTLLRLLNQRDYEGAAAQFARWVYAGGKRLEGLVRRRAAEEALFMRTSS